MAQVVAPPINSILRDATTRVDAARSAVALWMMVVVAAAVALITMAELDRIIATVVNPDTGESHSLSTVIGPLSFTGRGAWESWANSEIPASVAGWIALSVVLDAVFVACYVSILYYFVKRWYPPIDGAMDIAQGMAVAVVLAEGAEAVVLLVMAWGVSAGEVLFSPWVEVAASLLKWIVVLVVILMILRMELTRHALRRAIARGWQALWIHRLSAVPVALLAALACVPAEGVLDQLPDVQRQWIGSDDFLWHIGWAFGVIAVASGAAFALGRARTRRAVYKELLDARRIPRSVRHVYGWWLLPIGMWFVAAVIAGAVASLDRGSAAGVFGWGAAVFVAVPVLVLLVSLVLERWGGTLPVDGGSDDGPRAIYAWLTGDVVAIGLITVGGLGLVRSMALPIMLIPDGSASQPQLLLWAGVLFLFGLLVALASPWLMVLLATDAPRPLRFSSHGTGPPPTADRP